MSHRASTSQCDPCAWNARRNRPEYSVQQPARLWQIYVVRGHRYFLVRGPSPSRGREMQTFAYSYLWRAIGFSRQRRFPAGGLCPRAILGKAKPVPPGFAPPRALPAPIPKPGPVQTFALSKREAHGSAADRSRRARVRPKTPLVQSWNRNSSALFWTPGASALRVLE